jgi:hypothetical protein
MKNWKEKAQSVSKVTSSSLQISTKLDIKAHKPREKWDGSTRRVLKKLNERENVEAPEGWSEREWQTGTGRERKAGDGKHKKCSFHRCVERRREKTGECGRDPQRRQCKGTKTIALPDPLNDRRCAANDHPNAKKTE